MYYKYNTNIGMLEAPFAINLGALALITYEYFNQSILDINTALPRISKNTIEIIEKYYDLKSNHEYYEYPFVINQTMFNNKVLLACTGGLDSTYQAIRLKEQGYDLRLFCICENNNKNEITAVKQLAESLNVPFIRCNFIYQDVKVKNVFKNIVLYSLMMDYCQAENVYYISTGDDVTTDINTLHLQTDLAKAKQLTKTLFNDLYLIYHFSFIPAIKIQKYQKLIKLEEYNLLNTFYSCVGKSELNKINRNYIQTKYNVNLYANNCGKCKKCSLYNLLAYYYLNANFSQEFVDYCWLNVSKDFRFNNKLTFDEKFNNLSNY